MRVQKRDKRAWLGPFAPLAPILVLLALGAAAAALAVPGQVGERAGIASILAMAALASVAGNAWGLPVLLAASAALAGNVLPIVINSSTTGDALLYSSIALIGVLPGVAAFLVLVPSVLQAFTGKISSLRISRMASSGATLAVAAWMVFPAIFSTQSALNPTAETNPPVQVSVISASDSEHRATPATETSSLPDELVSPISASEIEAAVAARLTSAAASSE